jgi:hypothetical protein
LTPEEATSWNRDLGAGTGTVLRTAGRRSASLKVASLGFGRFAGCMLGFMTRPAWLGRT